MVLADRLCNGAPEVDVGDRLGTGLGMLADELHLGLRKPAWLGEDLGRHNDLADVVQQGGSPHHLDLVLAPAELGGDRAAKLRYPPLVAGGVGVTHLGRGAQR